MNLKENSDKFSHADVAKGKDMALTEPNELDIELRKYKLDVLLLLIADETRKMYQDGNWKRDVHWLEG